jgi:predicted transcriptional regulator
MDKISDPNLLLDKIAYLKKSFGSNYSIAERQKRNKEIDEMIHNIGDPRVAEKLRIYKLVEDQFEAIEKEVKEEVRLKMAEQKKEKDAFVYSSRNKARDVLTKAKKSAGF